jgi:hypothetical protein
MCECIVLFVSGLFGLQGSYIREKHLLIEEVMVDRCGINEKTIHICSIAPPFSDPLNADYVFHVVNNQVLLCASAREMNSKPRAEPQSSREDSREGNIQQPTRNVQFPRGLGCYFIGGTTNLALRLNVE